MTIEVHLDHHEYGTPFEFANAVIKNYMEREMLESKTNLIALDEIADHIKVFVMHTREAWKEQEE